MSHLPSSCLHCASGVLCRTPMKHCRWMHRGVPFVTGAVGWDPLRLFPCLLHTLSGSCSRPGILVLVALEMGTGRGRDTGEREEHPQAISQDFHTSPAPWLSYRWRAFQDATFPLEKYKSCPKSEEIWASFQYSSKFLCIFYYAVCSSGCFF